MARGRLLSTEASVDPELNSLSSESMLLYLLTLPHLDRDGLTDGTPMRLTAIAAPLRFDLRADAGALINEWVEAGLVVRYGAGKGRSVLFFKGFRKHQQGLEYAREPASKFPPPPGWTRTKDGLTPDDPELRFRLAEGMHVKSAYRAVLLRAAGADAPAGVAEPEDELENEPAVSIAADLPDTSRTVREGSRGHREQFAPNQIKEKLSKHDGDDALTPPTPVMVEGGVQGGGASEPAAGQPDEPSDLYGYGETNLRVAAYQLGSLLNLHQDWTAYQGYLAKRSPATLVMLLEWIGAYLEMPPAVLEQINSLPAIIRSHMNAGDRPTLTTGQRRSLARRVAEAILIANEDPAGDG